ncbi:MAG: aldo/keto reductase [Pseudomonadales bacterium]|nr:aldo/keto reductase [Pseudomonadales bacterium]
MKKVDRRSFLLLGAVTGLASGLSVGNSSAIAPETGAEKASSQGVRKYVRLGRTGMRVSDISFGSFPLRHGDEGLVHYALDRGINYFDTAESYGDGVSETVMGNALKGRRDDVYVATKIAAGARDSAESMMRRLDESLARLQMDYVDVFFNHAVNDVDRLKNPEWHEFAEKARAQGKVRYLGMSGHGGYLVDCVDYAVEQDMFDVLLLATNFGEDPAFYERFTRSFDFVANQQGLQGPMKKAKEKDIGIIAMKVLRGAKLNDMRPYEKQGYTYSQAAFRWVLNMPEVDNLIITMRNRDNVDEFLGASGTGAVTAYDMELLQQYAKMNEATYCSNTCNDCEGSCPYNVPIPDLLRMRMYALDYGDVSIARQEYARLEVNGAACLSCDGSPCRDACTHEIPLADLCGPTHQMLS